MTVSSDLTIVFPILLAGWVAFDPNAGRFLHDPDETLESKILRDRQTLVQLIGHLVGDDLSRSSALIDYYQTLPEVARMLTAPESPAGGSTVA